MLCPITSVREPIRPWNGEAASAPASRSVRAVNARSWANCAWLGNSSPPVRGTATTQPIAASLPATQA